jgi:DNA repair exonuclease SbcCD nuclease subunit
VDIFRRYCMGPDAVQVQILSSKTADGNGSANKKSPFSRGIANYEDEFYSVDLPVLSIHGNHDGALDMGLLEA